LRNEIRDDLVLKKDAETIVPAAITAAADKRFRSAEVSDRTVFMSTREAAAALTASPFVGVEAQGEWLSRIRQPLFAERDGAGVPLIRRIVNVLLVLTVEGPVTW
jgi:hypothetical protein